MLHHGIVVGDLAEILQLHADVLSRHFGELLERELAAARVLPLEATYLAWIDLRPLGLPAPNMLARKKPRALSSSIPRR